MGSLQDQTVWSVGKISFVLFGMKASKQVCRYRYLPYYLVGEGDLLAGSAGSVHGQFMQYILAACLFILQTRAI